MTQQLKNRLLEKYKAIFHNTFEAGGGYNFRYHHGLRTMLYCENFFKLKFLKKKRINKDAVLIASLFADVGKISAINKNGELVYGSFGDKNHDRIGASLINRYLPENMQNTNLLKVIEDTIRQQHDPGGQQTIEAMLVKDADRLDNYGFIQIWRHITYAHYDKRNIDRIYEFWMKDKAREIAKNYLKKFNFPQIRKIAEKRFRKLDYLIQEINQEYLGKDII